jgi:hypothetical protein
VPAATSAPIDPTSVTLQPDSGAVDAYTIQIPTDWQAENIPAPGGFGRRYTLSENGTRAAQLTVRCERGASIDDLAATDKRLITSIYGTYGANGVTDVTLAGLQGHATDYSIGGKGLTQDSRVMYLQGKICGWQILLQAFGSGQLPRYIPLFELILSTFKPVAEGG